MHGLCAALRTAGPGNQEHARRRSRPQKWWICGRCARGEHDSGACNGGGSRLLRGRAHPEAEVARHDEALRHAQRIVQRGGAVGRAAHGRLQHVQAPHLERDADRLLELAVAEAPAHTRVQDRSLRASAWVPRRGSCHVGQLRTYMERQQGCRARCMLGAEGKRASAAVPCRHTR